VADFFGPPCRSQSKHAPTDSGLQRYSHAWSTIEWSTHLPTLDGWELSWLAGWAISDS